MSETTAVMEKKPSTTRRKQQEAPEVTATLANFRLSFCHGCDTAEVG